MTETPTPPEPRWLRGEQALRMLRRLTEIEITRTSFYRWLENGTIPARRVVHHWYIDPEAIRQFAQETFEP